VKEQITPEEFEALLQDEISDQIDCGLTPDREQAKTRLLSEYEILEEES